MHGTLLGILYSKLGVFARPLLLCVIDLDANAVYAGAFFSLYQDVLDAADHAGFYQVTPVGRHANGYIRRGDFKPLGIENVFGIHLGIFAEGCLELPVKGFHSIFRYAASLQCLTQIILREFQRLGYVGFLVQQDLLTDLILYRIDGIQLHTFFSLILPNMTHQQKQILDEAMIKTYENFGITMRNKSLIDPKNPTQYKPMPILGDLYAQIQKYNAPEFRADARAICISLVWQRLQLAWRRQQRCFLLMPLWKNCTR